MHPRIVGNPLIAWRDDATLQIGWGTHSVLVEAAPGGLPDWLRLINGKRSAGELIEAAGDCGISDTEARALLSDLAATHISIPGDPPTVRLHPCGLLEEPLTRALRDAGVSVERGADVLVYPQGQLPTLVACPPMPRRLVPVWLAPHAVHVGPVLDRDSGPCPMCIDLAWAQADPAWPTLVAQAGSVATWHSRAQIAQAAALVALVADAPSTVGLEMILDGACPGPRWRVWSVSPECRCQLAQAAG